MNSVVTQRESRTRSDVRLPGEPGIWVVIFGDLLLFAVFFFTFMYYRAGGMEEFAASHAQMNGETVPVDEPFSNGMQIPGDPAGGVDEVAACRCVVEITVP